MKLEQSNKINDTSHELLCGKPGRQEILCFPKSTSIAHTGECVKVNEHFQGYARFCNSSQDGS